MKKIEAPRPKIRGIFGSNSFNPAEAEKPSIHSRLESHSFLRRRNNFLNQRNLLFLAGVLAVVIFAFSLNKRKPKIEEEIPSTATILESSLPNGWQIDEQISGNVKLKIKKQTEKGVEPTIVLIESEKDPESPNYLDQLIAGAKSTIPTLRYQKRETLEKQEYQLTHLEGFYYNGNRKINLIQQIYQKDKKLFIITASYLESSADKEILFGEISQIIEKVFENKIVSS